MSIPELFSIIMHFALDVYPPNDRRFTMAQLMRWRRNSHSATEDEAASEASVIAERLGATVVASHVCAAWRIACLTTPTLWARQVGMIPPAANVFLARSKSALLDVYRTANAVGIIRLSQIRTLKGSVSCLPTLLSGCFTNLVSLSIQHIDSRARERLNDIGTIDAPRLVHMEFDNVCLDRPFVLLNAPTLKSLSLEDCDVDPGYLLSILRTTPMLETLSIREGVVRGEPEQVGAVPSQIMELPRLKTISIDDETGDSTGRLTQILDHILVEPETFDASVNGSWTEPMFSSCLRAALTRGTTYLLIVANERMQFYHHSHANDVPLSCPWLNPYDTCAAIDCLTWTIIPHLCQYPRTPAELSQIPTLLLHVGNDWTERDDTTVRSLMQNFSNVETCWLGNDELIWNQGTYPLDVTGYDGYVYALAPGRIESDSADTYHLPFPRLRVLGIGVDEEEPTRLLDIIIGVLTARADKGMPALEVLSLPLMPPQDSAAVAQLLSLVPKIQWK
ncbi:unnamed protein product [Peniophora sp. CBMAI 1063]|nr:unnamed protein product [Peniophora sp. CBMAI 1063]